MDGAKPASHNQSYINVMGQAKRRGAFEQRLEQALSRKTPPGSIVEGIRPSKSEVSSKLLLNAILAMGAIGLPKR